MSESVEQEPAPQSIIVSSEVQEVPKEETPKEEVQEEQQKEDKKKIKRGK